jgi:hypothetical protein
MKNPVGHIANSMFTTRIYRSSLFSFFERFGYQNEWGITAITVIAVYTRQLLRHYCHAYRLHMVCQDYIGCNAETFYREVSLVKMAYQVSEKLIHT